MNRYINYFSIALIILIGIFSCKDSYMGVEQTSTNSTKPEKVIVNEVIPKFGSLDINFSLSKGNPDISYVVASYINKRGEEVDFKVSRYSSSILVEGFTGTDEVTVELVCVDNSGNKSEATYVTASPLISPVELAFNSLKIEPAFGGLKVDWLNKSGQPFAIHFLAEDSIQKHTISFLEDPSKTIYSTDSVTTHAYVRYFPPSEQKFGFTMSDKWGNRTDTLISFLTPYEEEKIDYDFIEEVPFFNPTIHNRSLDYDIHGVDPTTGIQNDGNSHGSGNRPKTMFNGNKSSNNFYCYKFIKDLDDPDPANRTMIQDVYATVDLNMSVRLSRIIVFPRTRDSYTYNRSSVKRFKIWGTNDSNNDRWSKFPETWTLIGEYVGPEPVDIGSLTDEEIEYFNERNEFIIAEDNVNPEAHTTKVFRYMRLQMMETYDPDIPYVTINEFEMYGEVLEYY